MNLMKSLSAVSLLAALMVGVNYAHSQDADDVTVYRTSAFAIGSCSISVKREGTAATFKASSYSATPFRSIVPDQPGELELPVSVSQSIYGHIEKLKITFDRVDGEIHPISFQWKDLTTREVHDCPGLRVEN